MKKIVLIPILTAALVLAGCTTDGEATLSADTEQATEQLTRYQANQPIPQYDWSQYRQTLIDIQDAQVHGVATTSFFYNQGSNVPIKSCPSIGYPIPTTAQLTNPEQIVYSSSQGRLTLPQMEQSGVYTGDSSGTYVVCVAPNGTGYVSYWEGFVQTEGGEATWNPDTQMIELVGDPTVSTTAQE